MAEPPPPPELMSKARDVLATQSHQDLESVVTHLFMSKETTEYQTAKALFNFLTTKFPNCLTLKLLHMYRSSSVGVLRSRLIYFLFGTLQHYKTHRFALSLAALDEIKPLVISCLRMTQEPEMINLRRIVSFIAHDVMILDNGGWDELSECIYEISSVEPLKALHVFAELPPVYEKFVYNCGGMVLEKAEKVLLVPYQDRVDDWSLGLQAVVKLGVQVLDSGMGSVDMVTRLVTLAVKAVRGLVEKGMDLFLVRGLAVLEMFLDREKRLYSYNKEQCDFVSCFLHKIKGLGPLTKEAAPPPSLVQQPQEHGAVSVDRVDNLQLLEILRTFASTEVEGRLRDMAIRRLNELLADYIKGNSTEASVLEELQPLLISCLCDREGISESMFKVLGEVVNSVAYEMMIVHVEIWEELGVYFASNSKTEFERAVYVFQCLTMWLPEEVIDPIVENLLPEINKRLNSPPGDVLVDNSCWVPAFLGAFCAISQLVARDDHAETVMEMADKMVDSVRELVERKMEVGFVRRAFRDLEILVKKQKHWFRKDEFKLAKSLLQRLYEIEGMTKESKVVVWRINVILEEEMANHVAA